jgi:hypothetical protein
MYLVPSASIYTLRGLGWYLAYQANMPICLLAHSKDSDTDMCQLSGFCLSPRPLPNPLPRIPSLETPKPKPLDATN